jgi:hypothetical protein
VRHRVDITIVACMIAGLAACGGTSSPAASKTTTAPPRPDPTTSTTRPSQPIDATGQAHLTHAGTNGFKLYAGTITSPTLGNGKFVEDGTFSEATKNPSWTAHGTLTAADGDTITFTSIGGVRSYDKQHNPHSATTETITGGTGTFSGATGTMKTTGITVIVPSNGAIAIQLYKFSFRGSITERKP